MNAFNRAVMILISLLLIAVPVLLILFAVGAVSADLADRYTNYRAVMDLLGNLQISEFDNGRTRAVIAVSGALVVIISLLLLLRELTFGRRVASNTVVSDEPGAETLVTARAVRALAEGAAREEGAVAPSVSLLSEGIPYKVFCRVQAPPEASYADLAARTRENILRVLEGQNVPIKDAEVTVVGPAPLAASQERGG